MTVQVAKLLLYLEQLLKGHNLLHQTWAERGLYIRVCIYTYIAYMQNCRYII
jgi:hypothetical protein